jgi:uncharacterized protein YkwD
VRPEKIPRLAHLQAGSYLIETEVVMFGEIALVLSLALTGEAPAAEAKAPAKAEAAAPKADAKKEAQPKKEAKKAEKEPVFKLTSAEKNLLDMTNKERVARGLPPFEIDVTLVESAREHANWMATRRIMQHTWKPVGENIAQGQADSASAIRTWMNSPPHRANMLSRGWTKVGAAGYTSPEGRIYWCLQFLR